ncbi:phosphatidylinositol glycan, class A [Babesia microti strain RI]|uniref:Phosphatidylinositol glycan, class A n=1 Tax=Babesia microti (strain RI) TaxID=1133968 RepID=A0A1N6LXV6_BABMR|nr:phosphatidylinositol glycan, class A [Babesia microti strain RI]SIO73705.1 phosphatidylinositol glycan, class A [Babesia microti strain RI]|eukprot:XP_021337772.1 phosphatidylinositol glycan, class A [Babesia microti strain RI]
MVTVLFASEFFYPYFGGIELHIYKLSIELIKLGYKVVVVTNHYEDRIGIRYMGNGIKVYYVPKQLLGSFPVGFVSALPDISLIRDILIRESVDIIHVHQAATVIGHQFTACGMILGCRTIYTDHSLFSFKESACIILNRVLEEFLTHTDKCICVSYASKYNLVLRTKIDPQKVTIIENALDANSFVPCVSKRPSDYINILVISRFTYRKGIDLLVKAIPLICQKHENVKFTIAGDGPKAILIEEMIEKYELQNRIKLMGPVPQDKVVDVMQTGHIFLVTSLTESFCIALLEAASCGMVLVSTKVGGVPEILPDDMLILSDLTPESVEQAVVEAIDRLPKSSPQRIHDRVARFYSWEKTAVKTDKVYKEVMEERKYNFYEHCVYRQRKDLFGIFFLYVYMLLYLYIKLLDIIEPRHLIEKPKNYKIKSDNK